MKTKLILILLISFLMTTQSFAHFNDEGLNKSNKASGNVQAKLSLTDKNELIKAIDEIKSKTKFDSKNFIITKTTQSNGGKFALQVEDYLQENGIKVKAYGTKSLQLKGFMIIKNENCFEIIIGVI